MKQGLNYALFGTVVAVAAGLIGAYGLTDSLQEESSFASAQILGHVTYTVTDADGNIKAYRQLDNIIVEQGEDCALKLLFASNGTSESAQGATGSTTCGTLASTTGSFNVIAIGNQTVGTNTAAATDLNLVDEHTEATSGFARIKEAAPAFTTAGGGSSANVVLSNDFTNSLAGTTGSMDVTESGLFNSTVSDDGSATRSGDAMFARQTFAAVTVERGESLTVEWTINLGGTTTLGGAEEL